jgi:superfamily II DNA/RNA helicase
MEPTKKPTEKENWTDFGLDDKILYSIKKNMSFFKPTSIQKRVITEALNGKDVLAKAATGSGKVKILEFFKKKDSSSP